MEKRNSSKTVICQKEYLKENFRIERINEIAERKQGYIKGKIKEFEIMSIES